MQSNGLGGRKGASSLSGKGIFFIERWYFCLGKVFDHEENLENKS